MWFEESGMTKVFFILWKIIKRYQFALDLWIGESGMTKFLFDTLVND